MRSAGKRADNGELFSIQHSALILGVKNANGNDGREPGTDVY